MPRAKWCHVSLYHVSRPATCDTCLITSRVQASDVSALCSVNNLTAPGVLSLGLAVCSSALAATLGPAAAARLDTWTRGLGPDTEAGLVNAAAAGNISAALAHLPQLFPAAGV